MATFTSKIAWTANDGNHRRGRSPDKEKDNFLRVQLFTMALNGIRKHETVSSRIYFYGCFLTMLIMDLAGVHFAYQNAGEILLVCDCLGPTFTCFLGVVKQYYLDVHREQLWYIIHELRKLKQNGFEMVVYLGTSLMLLYITYITAIVIQIFFFSYYGSQLLYESAAVGDAIYCSNWYEATPKTRKLLLFCIKRAQVPVNTKVGIMVASLPTFRAVLI
ncbi:hypothetical protein quinque_002695 [Culex quinquefasciatus]